MRVRSALAAPLLLSLFAAVASAGRYVEAQPGEEVSDGLLVRLREGAQLRGEKVPARYLSGSRWTQLRVRRYHRVRVDPAEQREAGLALAADPAVELVEPDRIRHLNLVAPNDASYGSQWNLTAIRALEAWQWFPGRYVNASLNLDRVRVAVLDTGVDCSHPDFRRAGSTSTDTASGGQINWSKSAAILATTATSPPCAFQDDHSHGSAVAGIIAAATNNQVGVSSLGHMLELGVFKIAGPNGTTTDGRLSEAIVAATDSGAKVISMSLSGAGYSQVLSDATTYAWARNVIVVAAVGNSGSSDPVFPAANHHVIGVGAFDGSRLVTSFSNRGNAVDVLAPGVSILSTTPIGSSRYGDTYGAVTGTSTATPHVSALAGILAMTTPGVLADEVIRRIQRSADFDQAQWSPDYGWGRIDAERALSGSNWKTSAFGGVSGQIVDQFEVGIGNATLTLNAESLTTETGGLFKFPKVAPGDYTLNVSAGGQIPLSVPVTVTAGADTPIWIKMGVPSGILRGSVSDPGAVVTAWQNGLQRATAVANAVGQYQIFVPVGNYQVRAGGLFTSVATVDSQSVSNGGVRDVPPLTLQHFGRLEGNVRNGANNQPVSGAQVAVSQTGRSLGGVSNASGDYVTLAGPAGQYLAEAEAPSVGVAVPQSISVFDNFPIRADFVLRNATQTITLSPADRTFNALAGSGSVVIGAGSSSLAWTAGSDAAWLQITSAASGTGSSTLNYSVAANATAFSRTGHIQVNQSVFTVTQTGATAAVSVDPATIAMSESGGSRSVTVTSSGVWVAVPQDSWISVNSPGAGSGNGTLTLVALANESNLSRSGTVKVNNATITVTQPAASTVLSPSSDAVPYTGRANGTISVFVSPAGSPWTAKADDAWITITGATFGIGSGVTSYNVAPNPSTSPRTGTISFSGAFFTVNQAGAPGFTLTPASQSYTAAGGAGSFTVTGSGSWTAVSNTSWIAVTSTVGSTVNYTVSGNVGATSRSGTISVGGSVFTVSQDAIAVGGVASGLHFVPVLPCRVADTRENLGQFGKPALASGAPRSFVIPSSSCAIPGTAKAYALNVTVVPKGPLSYITIWPTGQTQPLVSTLNSLDGRVKANAALVPAGTNGAINVMATDTTELVLDIVGYFTDPGVSADGLAFYPVTPCRVADTRNATGSLGGPIIPGGGVRSLPVLSAGCGIPATAKAYSINATVVPAAPLGYLTLWPTGRNQPFVSTLNAPTGGIVANAAIVPAGDNGAISAFATNATHLVIDINGYFAPPGSANAQRFYPVSPCRIIDTRNPNGGLGGPILQGGQVRTWPIASNSCGLPSTASAYSLNATVVPTSGLGFLTMWPAGQVQPLVSTLNAIDDTIVANAAIVVAGNSGGIATYPTSQTHLVVDTNGYFAP